MFNINLFTEAQGNFLIRLIIAHLIADFVVQSNAMVRNKKWFSKALFWHITIVFGTTLLFSKNWILSLVLTILHYLTDGFKIEFLKRKKHAEATLFIIDQFLHLAAIIMVWSIHFNIHQKVGQALMLPLQNYNLSLLLLSYILVTTPFGYLIGLLTKRFQNSKNDASKTDQNGLYIGIFERLIILTFMLLQEYSAIGFLITGKSIIRFSSKNEDIKSEYVLLGTMVSYGITIITGIIIRHLINF